MLAARCLGLIGPSDLQALVFDDQGATVASRDAASRDHDAERKQAALADLCHACFGTLLRHGLFSAGSGAVQLAIDVLVRTFSTVPMASRLVVDWCELLLH
jgi:hypothetical protein